MPSEEISAVSTPYCGRADAMEFSSRAVAARPQDGLLGKSRMGISFAMSEFGQHSSRNDVVHPRCWWCWKPMVLKRVYPTRLDHYNGKFECETCGRTKKRVIRIRVTTDFANEISAWLSC